MRLQTCLIVVMPARRQCTEAWLVAASALSAPSKPDCLIDDLTARIGGCLAVALKMTNASASKQFLR